MSNQNYNNLQKAKNYLFKMLRHRVEDNLPETDEADLKMMSNCISDLIKTIEIIDYYQELEADCL